LFNVPGMVGGKNQTINANKSLRGEESETENNYFGRGGGGLRNWRKKEAHRRRGSTQLRWRKLKRRGEKICNRVGAKKGHQWDQKRDSNPRTKKKKSRATKNHGKYM